MRQQIRKHLKLDQVDEKTEKKEMFALMKQWAQSEETECLKQKLEKREKEFENTIAALELRLQNDTEKSKKVEEAYLQFLAEEMKNLELDMKFDNFEYLSTKDTDEESDDYNPEISKCYDQILSV